MSIDVLSFGETMLRLSPPEGIRLDSATTFSVHVAGTESNTLCTLARLGLQTAWLSALPDTPLGRRVESELRRHGVQTTHILWQQDPTRLGIFYAEEAPPPLGIQVYYDRANSACATLDPDTLDYTLVDQARLLHLTGITPALSEQARAATTRLFQRALAQHIPISFDVNYRAKLWSPTEAAHSLEEYCRQASILICTREDAADLWHITGSPQEILTRLSNRFASNQQERTFVVTLGREGATELRNGQFAIAPALPTEGHFRFGSGDAFAAGYLYSYLDGPLYHELRANSGISSLLFGNALAALKRCIAGDIASISPQDVRTLLHNQPPIRFR